MYAPLTYLLSDNIEPPSTQILPSFFYEDHFTHLYQAGLKRIRDREDEIYYNSLLKALSELDSMQENTKNKHESSDFYAKNIDWLAQKHDKIRSKAENLIEEEDQRLEHEKRKAKKAKIAYNLPFNYVGPIKGWEMRFQEFKRKKSMNIEENPDDFRPKINENSRKLANFDSNVPGEKVEDRLMRKGKEKFQRVKKIQENQAKTADMEDIYNDRSNNVKKTKQEIIEFAEKLHKDAKIQAENRNNITKTEENRYPFKPEINKYKEIQRKPLYFIEKPEKSIEKSKKQYLNPEKWSSFLKRNAFLQEHKQKYTETVRKRQESAEIEGCSFHPEINPETIRILIRSNKGLLERQDDFMKKKREDQEQVEKKKEEDFQQMCTFKPKITRLPIKSPEKGENHLDIESRKAQSLERKTAKNENHEKFKQNLNKSVEEKKSKTTSQSLEKNKKTSEEKKKPERKINKSVENLTILSKNENLKKTKEIEKNKLQKSPKTKKKHIVEKKSPQKIKHEKIENLENSPETSIEKVTISIENQLISPQFNQEDLEL